MVRVLVHRQGVTEEVAAVDPAWLGPEAAEVVWVDVAEASEADRPLLREGLGLHELAVDDALAEVHHPKIETWDGWLYLILHGIVPGNATRGFETRDVDFFLGRNVLVTVHHAASRSIDHEWSVCERRDQVLADGPAAMLHRIVDQMVAHYRPEVDALEARLDELERVVFEEPRTNPLRAILDLKHDISALRRVALPQRDALARLARREFPQIPDAMAYRFRDVYDSLVRITDEGMIFQDRVTTLVDAHLSTQSNRLNQVMKVLTVIATIFMPLTVITGMFGMNFSLPHFPGGEPAQFWWVTGIMTVLSVAMLWLFRRMGWL